MFYVLFVPPALGVVLVIVVAAGRTISVGVTAGIVTMFLVACWTQRGVFAAVAAGGGLPRRTFGWFLGRLVVAALAGWAVAWALWPSGTPGLLKAGMPYLGPFNVLSFALYEIVMYRLTARERAVAGI